MKKIFYLLALTLLVSRAAFSQSITIAKLNYEQAEEAYLNEDYTVVLRKLEEAENKFGKINPPILYLRIMAQNKLLLKKVSEIDFPLLDQVRKNCDYYLLNYEGVPDIEEKYRDVYLISEVLNNNYPKTEEEWKNKKEKEEDLMFESAINDNNTVLMEQYLNNYPDSKKKDQAIAFLLENYLKMAEESIGNKNHDQTKLIFSKIKNYETTEFWSSYSDRYYVLVETEASNLTKGEEKITNQNINSALNYYEELNSGTNTNYKRKIQSLKGKEKNLSRGDYGYFIYKTGKEYNDIGIEFGYIPNTGVGISWSLVGAKQIFWDSAEQERFESNLTYTRSYINVNLIKKIIYPLSGFIGASYSYYNAVWRDYENNDLAYIPYNVDPIETVTLEMGFTLRLRPFLVSVGASFPYLNDEQKSVLGIDSNSKMDINFGIGFSF